MSRTPNELFSYLSFLAEPVEPLAVDGGGLDADSVFDPVQKLFQEAEYGRLGKGFGDWTEDLGGKPLEKRADTDPRALWQTIVRIERVVDSDGDVWSNGYDRAGNLVDARLLIGAK